MTRILQASAEFLFGFALILAWVSVLVWLAAL